jgi:16S rRNA (cytosine967-C5)-methyltransferase
VSVQDVGQRSAPRCWCGPGGRRLPAGARVLDACAAPGGKTAHLLERADLDLLALDSDPQRLLRVHDTLAPAAAAGARAAPPTPATPPAWWDGRPSTPSCSTRPAARRASCAATPTCAGCAAPTTGRAGRRIQRRAAGRAVAAGGGPGGRLLSTPPVRSSAEGPAQIDAFLQRHAPRVVRLDPASPGHLRPLPTIPASPAPPGAGDGFFYALIQGKPH